MKSETNTAIKSYRNAEVNGMEYNPCKNVEVLGNKQITTLYDSMWNVFGKNLKT